MQYECTNRGVQAKRPSDRRSLEPSSKGTPGAASQRAALPQPEQNSEWRRWDQDHGHMLWMGDIQEDWNNATIAGFFSYYGAEITITRKSRDNYCFVEFASAEEAKNFMAKHNHQPLPGKLGNVNRFNIRPRTRPRRWYRGGEHHSSCTGSSGKDDGGRGKGGGVHDSRGPRLETRNDEQVGDKRQHFRRVKMEREFHHSHQIYQGRGVGTTTDRGYYGPGKGDSDRGGHEGRAHRMTPASQQRAVPEHDFKARVAHEKHHQASRGRRLRSRSSSRTRPQLRQRSRSGSPPPSHGSDKRYRSTSSGRGRNSTQTRRRRYDPSSKQVRVPDSVVSSVSANLGSSGAPSTFAATARSSSRGVGSVTQGQERRLPQANDSSMIPVDRGGMDNYDGVKSLRAANGSRDSIVRKEGNTCRSSGIESELVGGERVLGGGAEGAGRRRAEPTTAASNGPPNDDGTSGSSHQGLGDGVEKDAKTATASRALEAAALEHRGTVRLESAPSESSCWPAGGTPTSNAKHHHRGIREEESAAFKRATGKASLRMHKACPSKVSPLSSPTALSPKCQPLQHGSHQQADTGTCAAIPTGSSRPFSDEGGGTNQLEDVFKEGSTTESVFDASMSSLDEGSRFNDGGGSGHLHVRDISPGSRAARPAPDFEPPAEDKVDERGSDHDVEQQTLMLARRGTKRQSAADITLAQVIDHHMARRRLNGVASGCEKVGVVRNSSCASASSGEHMANAKDARSTNHHLFDGKGPSTGAGSCADATQVSRSDSSAVVAAAWTNGCVLPLTQAVAPHMRFVAPIFAAEPEGRRVVVHTAAAVAAGAAILALPEHRLEVTGTCRDGILLELHPKEESIRCLFSPDRTEESAFLSACAGRLQATFNGLVELDLEFDMVRLPHGEAVDTMGSDSSSAELIQWLNEGTTTLVRLSAPREPPRTGTFSTGQAQRGADLVELRKALAHPSGTPFLGIDCIGPLLPTTGLLESFSVDIQPVVLPLPEPSRSGRRAHQSVIHLAVTCSDSGSSLSSRGGLLGGLHSCQSISSTPGFQAVGARDTRGDVAASDAPAADFPQPDASPLRCVPPTCTAGGLTWRHVTGLRCVAAVNKLALGSRKELEGKIQLAEGLHTAEIEGLAKRVTALPGVLLVILAGRQGAAADVIATRLCVELTIKGRNPAMLDTGKYLWDGASQGQVAAEARRRDPGSKCSPPAPHQRLDSVALDRAITILLEQARSGPGLSGVNNGGSRAAAGRQSCDIVVLHGCETLDTELLPPGKFGLGPAEATSVFIDLVPQVCVDNLTPINGADVRLLRSLLAAHRSNIKTAEAVILGYDGGSGGGGSSDGPSLLFDTDGFLEEWQQAEQREERLCRSFRSAASVYLNTALPYDLNVLKPMAEPLLRLVPPPTSSCRDSNRGSDGCRSSTYALSRSILRLLRLCEALHAPSIPATSVMSGLIRSAL